MPRRAATLRRRVREANLADYLAPFFAFVNEGRATWVLDGEAYSFDVDRSPMHADVQRVVRAVLSDLHRAGHAGVAASSVAHERLDPLRRDEPEAVAEDASVAEHHRRSGELKRLLTDAALIALSEVMLDGFLAAPAIEAFRLLGRCGSCERWFLEPHGQQTYCSLPCRKAVEREQTRSRVASLRTRGRSIA